MLEGQAKSKNWTEGQTCQEIHDFNVLCFTYEDNCATVVYLLLLWQDGEEMRLMVDVI